MRDIETEKRLVSQAKDLKEIKRRKNRFFKIVIILGPIEFVIIAIVSVTKKFELYIILLILIGLVVVFAIWAGEFDKLYCPHCSNELKYDRKIFHLKDSRFYCETHGYIEFSDD